MWILVALMYFMDITLWVIDVRNVVAELNTTLVDTYPDTLDERYNNSADSVLKLSLAVDVLYAFMVRHLYRMSDITMERILNDRWIYPTDNSGRCDRAVACPGVLVSGTRIFFHVDPMCNVVRVP